MFDAPLFRLMPPAQHPAIAACPLTGLYIPKGIGENLAWRKELIRTAATSATTRRAIKAACASSPIYWLNAFGWTYLQKRVSIGGREVSVQGELSHVPFLTWKVQDDAILQLMDAIDNGHDVVIDKSRDMGASWIVLSTFHWYFQFRASTTFLEMSRKESLVDRRGDMDSLFEKHRYLLKWQPEWLRPRKLKDNRLHLENGDIGTTIEGESTNENAGQASRKTAILLDEASRMDTLAEIDLATADTAACRIFNSTPGGPTTHFSRIKRAIQAGTRRGKLLIFPWWMHPDKGTNAMVETVDGREVVTSPWKKAEEARRSKQNVARNIDGDEGQAGDTFFSAAEIEVHRSAYQRPPMSIGNILVDAETDSDRAAVLRTLNAGLIRYVEGASFRPWRFWVPLLDWLNPRTREMVARPDQNARYVFGVDISNGSGQSNSVISVLNHHTNMIVAKFWDAFTTPEDLAEMAAFAGVWFGGKAPPLIIFEKNGPGSIFGQKLMKLNYPSVYYQEVLDQKSRSKTRKWGWHSSPAKKEMLLGEYRDALKRAEIINPCQEALDEALEYVYQERPNSDQARLVPGSLGSEEGGGQALHGDHVVADSLLQFGRKDLPKVERDTEWRAPKGSFAERKARWTQAQSDSEAWSK